MVQLECVDLFYYYKPAESAGMCVCARTHPVRLRMCVCLVGCVCGFAYVCVCLVGYVCGLFFFATCRMDGDVCVRPV